MNNYKLLLQYDGTKYSGWQMNKNAPNTLEEKLEAMLAKLLEEEVELIVQEERIKEFMHVVK